MKRIVLMALLALALPMAAFAGSVDFSNTGGTLTGSMSGLTLTGSELISAVGLGTGVPGELGTVAFSTGSMVSSMGSGTIGSTVTFAAGGTFTITSAGGSGLPAAGVVIFSGTFSGQVTLTLTGMSASGGLIYTLSGPLSGTWFNGSKASGATTQIYLFTGKNGWMGTSMVGSGDTILGNVPEPGTLGLLGTGLVGLAGIVHRKLRA